MIKDTRAASFRIESSTWLAFVEKAKFNNTDSSKLLRDWIDNYLSDNVIQDVPNVLQDSRDIETVKNIVREEVEASIEQRIQAKLDRIAASNPLTADSNLLSRLEELEKKLGLTPKTA